ncbi:major_cap_HK97, phage major capsid protein, HK97 family [uncultured Caudovirales phage]|uniref:Major_cap_HK97, phage major capsid protein, HK97 family n=1 Tax=uncultured Caudovirales phage TaxID=2100421 RepID=A0A6J5RGR7_9CAUD|nr:major_cap_HK97, phage major capsid protein, HK97 family [uncultured Caudovirales phage]CAB4190904.1 major_cap_HK97, phage major capsid protein, HK97 family [uncultured Caudovirales phage]
MRLDFSTSITAADAKTRTIFGQIVPFGAVGSTSLGPVIFEAGSLHIGENVKVLLEHDGRRPVGKLVSHTANPSGIMGEMKISQTTAGSDVLVEAADGLRDGISVGANIIEHTVKDGNIIVTAAELVEVSLVTSPAFADARVTQVAASADDETETIEEIEMTEQPIEVIEEVAEVEASKIEASTFGSPIFTQPRELPKLTAGQYATKMLQAQRGNREAIDFVTAAGEATTGDNSGLIPVPFMREIIGVVDSSRPFVDSIDRRPLPAAGMSFRIPRWQVFPTVAETAELGTPSDTMTEIDDLVVDVVKFSGQQRVSIELLERSDPGYLDELLRGLAASYAQQTDLYAFTEGVVGCGASSGTGYVAAIADAISDSATVMRRNPNRLVVGASRYAALLAEVDDAGRPLFNAVGPTTNAAGTNVFSRGNVMGLDLVVDYNIGATNILAYPSDYAAFYESGTAQVRVNVIDTMTVEIAVYGFVALANKYPTAIRAITVS